VPFRLSVVIGNFYITSYPNFGAGDESSLSHDPHKLWHTPTGRDTGKL
jgi:hypothetical protein